MLYQITKPIAKFAFKVYFRKIYISNAHRIPKNKPVILAANHPTAFIEPCILACWLDEPLHFMARGDFVLKSKFFKKLYDLYHIIPIYRIQDAGYGKLKDNFSAFSAATQFLKDNKQVLILAEGTSVHEKRLRPIKKGVSRVAFGSLEQYPDLDIQIVPVGVNYSDSDKMRTVAMIDFGEPIPLNNFKKEYKENKNKAIKSLTEEITNALSKRVIHIENREEEKQVEKLLDYLEAYKITDNFPQVDNDVEVLNYKKRIVDKINDLNKDQKSSLYEKLDRLDSYCKRLKISFLGAVNERDFQHRSLQAFMWLFPVFILGYLGNFLPIWGAGYLSKKYIKDIGFRASTSIVMGIILYLIYWLVLIIIGAIIGNIWILLGILALPYLGRIALTYKDLYKVWRESKQIKKLGKVDRKKFREAKEALDFEIRLINQT